MTRTMPPFPHECIDDDEGFKQAYHASTIRMMFPNQPSGLFDRVEHFSFGMYVSVFRLVDNCDVVLYPT